MALPSALESLASIVPLAIGVLFLIPVVRSLLLGRSFHGTDAMFPSSWKWAPETSLGFLAVLTLVTGNLLRLLPRMVMTLCAGLF